MRLHLALLLAAACGGGGGTPAFTPSQNLAETHASLSSTVWKGTLKADGIDYPVNISFAAMPTTGTASAYCDTTAPGIFFQQVLQADGDRIRLAGTDTFTIQGQVTTTTFEGTVRNQQMDLTWKRESTVSVYDGDTGTASLQRFEPPPQSTIEVYDLPELLLVVRTTR